VNFINRSSLPPEAFRCPTCNEIAGTCVHTDKTTNPRYEVRVCGIITGRREPMDELLVMGPVTPKPFPRLELSNILLGIKDDDE
jgi:hypothetical protein